MVDEVTVGLFFFEPFSYTLSVRLISKTFCLIIGHQQFLAHLSSQGHCQRPQPRYST